MLFLLLLIKKLKRFIMMQVARYTFLGASLGAGLGACLGNLLPVNSSGYDIKNTVELPGRDLKNRDSQCISKAHAAAPPGSSCNLNEFFNVEYKVWSPFLRGNDLCEYIIHCVSYEYAPVVFSATGAVLGGTLGTIIGIARTIFG